MKTIRIKSWLKNFSLMQVLKGDATPTADDQADALEKYAAHVRSGGALGDDIEMASGILVIGSKQRKKRRTLIVAVDADIDEHQLFNPMAVLALREYADAINDGVVGQSHQHGDYKAINGCTIMFISGSNSHEE